MEDIVSVIVCTYNQEDTIGRTLDSILMQQCHLPLEIVIGEDCSSDGTLDVCKRYQQQHPHTIRILANRPNKGIVDNYFDCLLACRGRYIADCAGDDYWVDAQKLEREVSILEQHPDVALVHTDWQYVNTHDGSITPSPAWQPYPALMDGREMLVDIITQTYRPAIHLCTALYRADWIREAHDRHSALFRNSAYGCEDLQVCFFMALRGKVAYIPQVTLNYSWGGETISNSANSERQFRFFLGATQLSHDLAQQYGLRGERVDRFLQQRAYALMMHAFRAANTTLRDEAEQLPSQWGIPLTAQMRLVRFITHHGVLWRAMLRLRQLYIRMKARR